MNYLFGFPVGIYKINYNDYDKQKIVSDIIHNYKIDTNRNKWDSDSNLHHENGDTDNDKFRKINYSSLLPLYDEKVKEYLSNFKFREDYRYRFNIVNYTCTSKGQFMKKHIHPGQFSAAHHIKFNKEEHKGTTFHNRHPYIDYMELFKKDKKFNSIKDISDISHSWSMKDWTFHVDEDDICFSPASLMHSVSQVKSDDLRITIIINVDIY